MKFQVGDVVRIMTFYRGDSTPYGPNLFEVIKVDQESPYGGYTLLWLRQDRCVLGREVAEYELALVEPTAEETGATLP